MQKAPYYNHPLLPKEMFTLKQITSAHSKVRSGADFPAYIQDIKQLGVTRYEVFVTDGHTIFYGKNDFTVSTAPKYQPIKIAETANITQFKKDIADHQQGKTDYQTFCNDCATAGINKWVVNIEQMLCTYYDCAGNEILIEIIPTHISV